MAVRAQLETDGTLKLTGTINSRKPSITNGLIAHYPFDGTTSPVRDETDFNNLKVLAYGPNATHIWLD
jgi:hypothetical protein